MGPFRAPPEESHPLTVVGVAVAILVGMVWRGHTVYERATVPAVRLAGLSVGTQPTKRWKKPATRSVSVAPTPPPVSNQDGLSEVTSEPDSRLGSDDVLECVDVDAFAVSLDDAVSSD
jgi:hypothetical protein